jgi:uncharacterized membrane protein YfcA
MKRATQRRISLVALAAFSAGLIVGMFDGAWLFRDLPGKYLGYFGAGVVLLGLLGVNVWWGGPLDPRRDEDQAK